MKSIKSAPISSGMKVLVRCDLDVPIDNGVVEDTFRLDHLLPTLELIVDKGGIPVILGHLGRPEGKYIEDLSTKHLSSYFDEKLGVDKYVLLENLRFDARERTNDDAFAKELASQGDIYVNESFATSHREHTSMVALPKFLPSYSGLRLEEEIKVLTKVLEDSKRPLVAIVGGAKIETKQPVIEKLLDVSDAVLVGGKIGIDWKEDTPDNLYLPKDYVDGKDIGKKTIEGYSEIIQSAKTIIWSGPVGMFEDPLYVEGTELLAQEVVMSGAFCVVGGGDTIGALNYVGLLDKIDFVSTGGGAMLEFLVKGTLPALKAIK